MADGDARCVLNSLEVAASLLSSERAASETDPSGDAIQREITIQDIETAVQKKALLYDKSGEEHYNLISAFHKSLRGSDPDAALYWLERMIASGEDPIYVARRMVRFRLGRHRKRRSLCAGYHAPGHRGVSHAGSSRRGAGPGSGSGLPGYGAQRATAFMRRWERFKKAIEDTGALPVPFHIRNAPTRLMKDLGYGDGYRYAHDFQDAFVAQDYLPEPLQNKRFYLPSNRGYEKTIQQRMEYWRKQKAEAIRQESGDRSRKAQDEGQKP